MLNDVFEESRKRILRAFPERQIYLRSGGEVSYYVFGTKLQMAIVGVISFLALWSLITLFNLIWGHNPFRAPAKEVKRVKAQYERLLEDSRAKEANARLMLDQQRESFKQVTQNLEEKHETLSQIFKSGNTEVEATELTRAEYAKSRVLMSPKIRSAIPRQDRTKIVKKASLENRENVDGTLLKISDTQDSILEDAETQTLDRIENSRAIIRSTDLNIETVLQSGPLGKGGLFIDLSDKERRVGENGFGSRIASIKARVAEAEALDDALISFPFGHPIEVDNFRTSSYGTRKDPFTKRPTFHEGVDFASYRLAPIVATAAGTVSYVGRKGGYGRIVEIDHGHGFVTRYAHLEKSYVKRGQRIEKGHKIGGMGSTGRSTSTHLHYEIHFQGRVCDPDRFLKAGNYVQQD